MSPNHQFTAIHIDFGPPPRPTTTAAVSAVPAPRHAALAAAPAFGAPRNRPTMRAAHHTWQVKKCVPQQGPEAKRKKSEYITQLWRVGEKIKSWSLMIMNPSFCVVPTHTCERLLKMWSKCFNTVGFSQFHGLSCFSYVCNATNRNHNHLWLITKWKSSPIPCQPIPLKRVKKLKKKSSRHLEDNSCTFAADFSALFLRLVSTKKMSEKMGKLKASTWSIGASKQKRERALMRTRWWKASHEEATQGYETWSSFIHNFAGSSPTTGINLLINWAPRIVEPQIPEVLKIIPPTEYFMQLITPSL